jgi:hypothetical protein
VMVIKSRRYEPGGLSQLYKNEYQIGLKSYGILHSLELWALFYALMRSTLFLR